ncbi:uncharacterized protein [Asterias amurensis]|uniref:uncharacterized protein n=1 Tax=Asterias amurensis TaxID=7602 RepID=UPI003AB46B3F
MDRSLFGRAVKYHGSDFDRLVKEEQTGATFLDETAAAAEATDTSEIDGCALNDGVVRANKEKTSSSKRKDIKRRSKHQNTGFNEEFIQNLHGFIARKADLFFKKPDELLSSASSTDVPLAKDDEKSDYYAIIPPLEQFMGIDIEVCQEKVFGLLKVDDVVCGRVLTTKEFGIFVKLLALCKDTSRFLEDCEVVALLPAGELRDRFSNVASVGDFSVGDLVRAVVTKVTAEEQKVLVSLHAREDLKEDLILGLITEADLPVHYRRSVLQLDSLETYGDMLESTVGFDNPFNVSYLGVKLGLGNAAPMSLMRGLQRKNFPDKEFSEPLRKWQTNRWSMESVAKGVEHFKAERFIEAMQHLNKALEIDEQNVEAFVARGALYANRDHLSKALGDFSKALKVNPNHRNANKYMCETLLERGKQLEEAGTMEKAADCYKAAIEIKPGFLEAQLCLSNIKKMRTPKKITSSPESISSASPGSPDLTLISAETLRQMVDTEHHTSAPTKSSAEKSKKKKKKKGKERDKSSSRKDEKHSSKSKKRSKKKRKYSRSSDSSVSSKPSRSRGSLHSRETSQQRSGRKLFREERKADRTSSKKRADSRKRSKSYSSSSSRSRSRSRHLIDRKRTKSGRRRSGYNSESISSDCSSRSGSKHRNARKTRKLEVVAKTEEPTSYRKSIVVQSKNSGSAGRGRTRSNRSSSESTYGSLSPEPSRKKSKPESESKKKRDEKSQAKKTAKHLKTRENQSPSVSPRSRRSTISKESQRSHTKDDEEGIQYSPTRTDGSFLQKGINEDRARSKSSSKDGSHPSRRHSRDVSPQDQMKMGTQKKDIHNKGDVSKKKAEKYILDKAQRDDSGSKTKSSKRQRNQSKSNNQDAKRGRRDRKSQDRRNRSMSRGSYSESSYSDSSYSDGSYSSYSLSGSRSYSYSSYSSYTASGSSSDSDDMNKSRKRSRPRSRSPSKTKSRKSDVRKPQDEDEDDSDSDVDTGMYEISRDHLEMYMESKSYQTKKAGEGTPLKKKKRKHSEQEQDEPTKNSKVKSQEKEKALYRTEKLKTPIPPEIKKEELKKPPVAVPFSDVRPAKKRRFKEVKDEPSPSHQQTIAIELAKPAKVSGEHIHPSSHVPFRPSLEGASQTGHNLPLVSHQSIEPGAGPHHQTGVGIIEQQRILPRKLHQSVPDAMINDRPQPREPKMGTNIAVPPTASASGVSKPTGVEEFTLEMFTPEQQAVIKTISKQMENIRRQKLQEERACSGVILDTNDNRPSIKRPQEGHDGTRGERLADVKSQGQGQGHHIGVIVSQRPVDNHDDQVQSTKSTVTSFPDQSGHLHGVIGSRDKAGVEVEKPAAVTIDYQHGQNIIMESKGRGILTPELPSVPTIEQVKSSRGPAVLAERAKSSLAGAGDMRTQTSKEERERNRRKTKEMEPTRSHHSSKGQRSHDDTHARERSADSSHYSSKTSEKQSMDKSLASNHPRHTEESAKSTKVIDYQHGRSERRYERSGRDKPASSRHQDRYGDRPQDRYGDRPQERYCDRPLDNLHEASYDRPLNHRDGRDSHHHRYGDRRPERDRRDEHSGSDRYHGGTSTTKGDRYQSRPHSRYSERHGSRSNQSSSRTPVRPRESNAFHKLITFNKDIQVAVLHSEGKWARTQSPEVEKRQTRTWWL